LHCFLTLAPAIAKMFVDLREIGGNTNIDSEVCIVGGGVAGITIALELEKQGIPTVLIESGGFKSDSATRDLYRGESTGLPYGFADGCRSRFLGGSSNCWGGWCRPLNALDFERRAWIADSGWPFGKSELQPYYERSLSILRLGPNSFDTEFWIHAIAKANVQRIPFFTGRVTDGISHFSPPVRFGKLYRQDLERAKLIKIYLHANATEINVDESEAVRFVEVKTLTGVFARVTARIFVLATGGIENARLLLASDRNRSGGVGNQNDLVGRFFMDHPRLYSGQVRFHGAWKRNILYDLRYHYHNRAVSAYGTCVAAQLALAPKIQAKEELLNARVCFSPVFPGEYSEAAKSLIRFRQRLQGKDDPSHSLLSDSLTLLLHPVDASSFSLARYLRPRSLIKYFCFQAIVEPAPDRDSRVSLSSKRDQLGMKRVNVHWRLGSQVKRTFDRTLAIVAEELESAKIADVILDPSIESNGWPDTFETEGTWHHIGTTRMHDSPLSGVVDRDCLVYGTNNLFIAGSSVFPTAGANFPTITIVALALRLSDHISRKIKQPLALQPVPKSPARFPA